MRRVTVQEDLRMWDLLRRFPRTYRATTQKVELGVRAFGAIDEEQAAGTPGAFAFMLRVRSARVGRET